MGPQCLEDLIREPMGARAILVNVIKHIAEVLPGPSPPSLYMEASHVDQ